MNIPTDATVHEMKTSYIWISKEGILFSKPKLNAIPAESREEIIAEMKALREIMNHRKMCLVLESDPNSRPPAKEMRDFIAEELASISKAMAIVTTSPLSRMIANLFFSFKPPEYPVKMFANEEEATRWVRQYL
jgi:hypothetical protein